MTILSIGPYYNALASHGIQQQPERSSTEILHEQIRNEIDSYMEANPHMDVDTLMEVGTHMDIDPRSQTFVSTQEEPTATHHSPSPHSDEPVPSVEITEDPHDSGEPSLIVEPSLPQMAVERSGDSTISASVSLTDIKVEPED
jgi:hypothetical protein